MVLALECLEDRTVPTLGLSLSAFASGMSASVSGSVNSGEPMTSLSMTYAWGDSTSDSDSYSSPNGSGTYPVGHMHSYTTVGDYTITVTAAASLLNGGSDSGTATFSVTAASPPSPPSPPISPPPPAVSVAKLGSDPTEGGTGTFRISRSGSTASALAVAYSVGGTATSGTDYTGIGTGATIPMGFSYVDVPVPTLADNVVEDGGETVVMTITDGGTSYTANGASSSMTIVDDPPVVSLSSSDASEAGIVGNLHFSRSGGNIAAALSISYSVGGTATSGLDYMALAGAVSIPAGAAFADVPVAALRDNLVEGTETVTVTIAPTTSYLLIGNATSATTTVQIADDPAVISVAATGTTEGGIPGNFRISRTGGNIAAAIGVGFTVAGTATPGDDYTLHAVSF